MVITKEKLDKLFLDNYPVVDNLTTAYMTLQDVVKHIKFDENNKIIDGEGWQTSYQDGYETINNQEIYRDFLIPEVIDVAYQIGVFKNIEGIEKLDIEQVKKVVNKETPKESEIIKLLNSFDEESTKNREEKEELLKTTFINDLANDLADIYRPIYEGGEVYGILLNDTILKVHFKDETRKFELEDKVDDNGDVGIAGNLREYTNHEFDFEQFDYNYQGAKKLNADKNRIFITKKNLKAEVPYFPHFHLAIAKRMKGIYEELNTFLDKEKLNKINDTSVLKKFATQVITESVLELSDELGWIKVERGEAIFDRSKQKEIESWKEKIIKSVLKVCIITKYEKNLILSLREYNPNKEIDTTIISDGETKDVKPDVGNPNIRSIVISPCLEEYNSMPFFATNIIDYIRQEKGSGDFNIIIGQDPQGGMVKINLGDKAPENSCAMLIAGSRSGKGVMTLTILANALLRDYPVIYLDCKPDMAKTFYQLCKVVQKETLSIDGFGQGVLDRIIDGKDIEDYVAETMPDGLFNFIKNNMD